MTQDVLQLHNQPLVDTELLKRFDVAGPRYTSYPTADRFVEAFGPEQHSMWLAKRQIGGLQRPLSVYVHLPFCNTICYYCGCNKIVTRDYSKATTYLEYLEREVRLQTEQMDDLSIVQLHWGGGTPNFLHAEQMRELTEMLFSYFIRDDATECSIEVDPRSIAEGSLTMLAQLGFTRLSVGVQDFDNDVQHAINRIQSEAQTARVIDEARAAGFKSVNIDLIYGLPKQTVSSFGRTLEQVAELEPDRVAIYNYAHLPHVFKPQRRINADDLPDTDTRLKIFSLAVQRLSQAGYVHIGMDHFAKYDDELAVAQRQGRLHRNFQGYSTHADCDLLGLGVSAISALGPTFSQNVRTLEEYYLRLDNETLPVMRGIELTADDLVRRAVIQALMCHFELAFESIEISYLIDFKEYFKKELSELQYYVDAGLITIEDGWMSVTERGRFLVRAICMVFDRYLREARQRASYSKVM
ncbi:MAG: oxygen-independent coproporphyrinogen III oxidase [Burkholderiales bacterium]